MAYNFFGLDLEVHMVKVSYNQKPYRRAIMQNFGAKVYAGPTDHTQYGRSVLAKNPNRPSSPGVTISKSAEVAATGGGVKKVIAFNLCEHGQFICGRTTLIPAARSRTTTTCRGQWTRS
ncbi:MAG: hypothetical protein NZM11_01310 [Anaerolineales bacterium]|nr:hypothetical protein [Anaerolineales bacterium]